MRTGSCPLRLSLRTSSGTERTWRALMFRLRIQKGRSLRGVPEQCGRHACDASFSEHLRRPHLGHDKTAHQSFSFLCRCSRFFSLAFFIENSQFTPPCNNVTNHPFPRSNALSFPLTLLQACLHHHNPLQSLLNPWESPIHNRLLVTAYRNPPPKTRFVSLFSSFLLERPLGGFYSISVNLDNKSSKFRSKTPSFMGGVS